MATGLFVIAAFMVVGFLSMGTLADRLARIGVRPISVGIFGMCMFTLAVTVIALNPFADTTWVWYAFGLFGTFGILPYTALSQTFPKELTGRVVTGLNVLVFFGAFAVQWGVGAIINQWPEPSPGHFAPEGYQCAFLIVAAIQASGLLWYALYRKGRL